jgi:uncharacterized membrane protein
MFEELLISVLFIIVLIILCIISNLYSKKEKEKETIKNNDTDWMNIFKKKEKINELNRLLIDELIEDIVVSEDGNIKVIFKYEDKYFEALDFINKQKYDIILSS